MGKCPDTPLDYSMFVSYPDMDPFKVACQRACRDTFGNLGCVPGFSVVPWTLGESVSLIETPWGFLGHVNESLGTKNLAAEAMQALIAAGEIKRLCGRYFYSNVAQCTVAMIINDLITLGVQPLRIMMHLAAGDSSWFSADEARYQDLIDGWKYACGLAGCVWMGGETPVLPGMIDPGTIVLSGSADGIIIPKERLIRGDVEPGDRIILLGSSGLHANGISMAREVATRLPDGYLTDIGGGVTYGEALLEPTLIYAQYLWAANSAFRPHYTVNITGHGWAKLMRLTKPFRYVIKQTPEPQPIFGIIQQYGQVAERKMWTTYNKGAGFALYVSPKDAAMAVNIAAAHGIRAWDAGYIEEAAEHAVYISPHDITLDKSDLDIR